MSTFQIRCDFSMIFIVGAIIDFDCILFYCQWFLFFWSSFFSKPDFWICIFRFDRFISFSIANQARQMVDCRFWFSPLCQTIKCKSVLIFDFSKMASRSNNRCWLNCFEIRKWFFYLPENIVLAVFLLTFTHPMMHFDLKNVFKFLFIA